MSELEKALAAVGESAPERPMPEPIEGGDECDEVNSLANRLGLHVTALESLALRLAVRLERAERCCFCNGTGQMNQPKCPKCGGTGKEHPR